MSQPKKLLYFAYGSNMSHKQMTSRCPHAKYLRKVYVKGKGLTFAGYSVRWRGGGATLVHHPKERVWGGLFEIDEHCRKRLDRIEGVKYKETNVMCYGQDGPAKRAITYVRSARKHRKPSRAYLNVMLHGAADCSLPDGYVTKLMHYSSN